MIYYDILWYKVIRWPGISYQSLFRLFDKSTGCNSLSVQQCWGWAAWRAPLSPKPRSLRRSTNWRPRIGCKMNQKECIKLMQHWWTDANLLCFSAFLVPLRWLCLRISWGSAKTKTTRQIIKRGSWSGHEVYVDDIGKWKALRRGMKGLNGRLSNGQMTCFTFHILMRIYEW